MAGSQTSGLEALRARSTNQQATIESAKAAVQNLPETPSQRRTGWARLVLAIGIIAIYGTATLIVMAVLSWRSGTTSATVIDPYAAALVDVLKVVILPVVTFMLGYYFGTGSVANDKADS